MTYRPGKVRAICDRTGFEYPLSELKREWTGLMVHKDHWDPRPPEMSAPNIGPEGVAKPNSRPDNQIDNTPNTTTQDDL